MIEQLEAAIAGQDPVKARNLVREILQAKILAALQRAGGMIPLAFQGGTALRFLYRIPRWSEDLAFALERPREGADLTTWIPRVLSDLGDERLEAQAKTSSARTVHHAFVGFPALLHRLGLAGRPQQVLSVRIEVDTRPPAGAGLETTVVRLHEMLHLQHHDRASLFAGKLHAILARPHAKGRDLHDLAWYLAAPDWPEPNLTMLRNALTQTGWTGALPTATTWRRLVRTRLEALDWDRSIADVAPFLEDPRQLALLTRENVLSLLRRRAAR